MSRSRLTALSILLAAAVPGRLFVRTPDELICYDGVSR